MKVFLLLINLLVAGECWFIELWKRFIQNILSSLVQYALAFAADYELIGDVESVSYAIRDSWPCYIAIRDETSHRSLYYHAARHEGMCNFAEKCRDRGIPVKMQAHIDSGANNVVTIEYAGTSAIYW